MMTRSDLFRFVALVALFSTLAMSLSPAANDPGAVGTDWECIADGGCWAEDPVTGQRGDPVRKGEVYQDPPTVPYPRHDPASGGWRKVVYTPTPEPPKPVERESWWRAFRRIIGL